MGMAADRFYCNYNTLHRRKTIGSIINVGVNKKRA